MKRLRSTFTALWNKTESLSPLVLLMLVSLFLALLLGGGNDTVGALALFQSSPPATSEAPSEGGPPAPSAEAPEEPEGEEEPPPPEESAPLIFNWGVFLNTVIVTLSYAWICCGVCGLVGTPLAFILIYVEGQRRLRQKLEESEGTEQSPEADQTG